MMAHSAIPGMPRRWAKWLLAVLTLVTTLIVATLWSPGATAVTALDQSGTAAYAFPDRPITIVVTFPPGGGTDLLARHLAVRLETALGVPIIVENRPGASGNIGARLVASARPDGHTLLMVNSSFAINPGVYTHLGFSPIHDFEPVFNVAWIPSVLVTATPDNLSTLEHVLQQAGADMLPVATCGNGTPQHLAVQMLHEASQSHFQHIPYRGCAPALADVASGTVPLGIVTISSAIPFIQSGRLHPLAVTSPHRSALLPEVPAVAEHGMQEYSLNQWHGLLAPAGVPDDILELFARTLHEIVQSEDMQDTLLSTGYAPADQTRKEFSALVAEDISRFGALTARMGLRVD